MYTRLTARCRWMAALLALSALAACGDDVSLILDGTYLLDRENSPYNPQFDGAVVFDRAAGSATFYACSTLKQCPAAERTKLVAVPATLEADWGSGCPTNTSRTELEIVALDTPSLTLGQLTFVKPVLVASCPTPSAWLSLNSQGLVPLGGCSSLEKGCLSFIRR